MLPTDATLVEQCLKGEKEAFARIVERYQHRVFHLALTRMRNRQDADDLAQETFLQAYRKLESFDQRYSFKTWLFTICVNLGKNRLRGLARRREVHHPDIENSAIASGDGHLSRIDLRNARTQEVCSEAIVLSLPEGQRGRWKTILDRGAAAGLERISLERALARLAAANVSPEKAETIFSPLFVDMEAGEHARQVFLEIEEGILKKVPFEALVRSVFKKNDFFLRARNDLLGADPANGLEQQLQASFVGVMEEGLSEEFVRQTVVKGKKLHSNKTKYLLHAVQLLHYAGLEERELKVFVQNCFEKDLGLEEIDSLVRHIIEKLRDGVDGKTICQGLSV